MRRIFSRAELRIVSAALAVALLIASAPLTAGVIVVSGPSHPQLTVDICHRAASFDRPPATLLARPAPVIVEAALSACGASADAIPVSLIELRIAPDTPPPRLSA